MLQDKPLHMSEEETAAPAAPAPAGPVSAPVQRFVLLLLPGHSLLSVSGLLDTLALANRLCRAQPLISLCITLDGAPVTSSSGLALPVAGSLRDLRRGDLLLLCGTPDIPRATLDAVTRGLRSAMRHGVRCGGLDRGAEVLAMAGLLNGKTATTHWRHQSSFAERYPQVVLARSAFVYEHDSFSCAAGTAAIDLALCFIRSLLGGELADQVADELSYTQQHRLQALTSDISPHFAHVTHPRLRRIIRAMDDNVEYPLPMQSFSELVGISQRQVERLFLRYVGLPPKRFYDELRLDRARNLLLQSEMPITEVAMATGFSSPSHFSKKFRLRFGQSPFEIRSGRIG